MLQVMLGLQFILVFFFGAKLLDNATHIGFFASVVFGGIPAVGVMGALYAMLPRIMVAVGTVFWMATGYSFGSSLEVSGATMAAMVVLPGVMGLAANLAFASEAQAEILPEGATQTTKAWKAPNRKTLEQSGYDLHELAQGVGRLFHHQIIRPATYARLTDSLPSPGKIQHVDPDSDAGCQTLYVDLAALTDNLMLAPDEEPEAQERLEQLTDPGETRRTAAVKSRAAAEASFLAGVEAAAVSSGARSFPAVAPAAPVPSASQQMDALRTLAQCRALSMDAFVRGMLKLDPDYDPLAARLENFPQVAPGKDLESAAKALYQSGTLSLDDLQTALEVIRRPAQG